MSRAENLMVRSTRLSSVGRTLLAVGTGVALLAVVAACGSSPSHAPSVTASRPGPTLPSNSPDPQPGTRAVTFHGLTVRVPDTWGLNSTRCGSPIADTVVLPGPVPACAVLRPARVSSVSFLSGSGFQLSFAHPTPSAVGSVPALWVSGQRDGFWIIDVSVPSLAAGVEITSPSRADAEQLSATLSVQGVDANGCASQAATVVSLRSGARAVRAGAGSQLVPPGSSAISLCRYVAGWLEQGVTLDAAARTALVGLLNALPRGVSIAPSESYDHALCAVAGRAMPVDHADAEYYLGQVRYPSGAPLTLTVRLGLCGDLGVSNGTIVRQRTMALAEKISSLAGASQGYPFAVTN